MQLGAFANFANAQNFVAHLANQIAPLGVEPGVRQVNGLFRVFIGPYPARDDAKRMADRLRDAMGVDLHHRSPLKPAVIDLGVLR